MIAGRVTEAVIEPVGVVVIHAATAAHHRLYRAFSAYLSEHGYHVVTYAYRGTGFGSGTARDHRDVRMRDWMATDVEAVADWARRRWTDLPHLAIGHSVGGHALALGHGTAEVAGVVLLASHVGALTTIPNRLERARVALVLAVFGPVLSRALGYFPARRLGLGEDIPGAAMLEWGRWSRSPGYLFDDPTMDGARRAAGVTGSVLVIGFTDDPWATPAQVDALAAHLVNAQVDRRSWSPSQAGVASIGHFGFLRPALADTLWPQVLAWLDARVAEAAQR